MIGKNVGLILKAREIRAFFFFFLHQQESHWLSGLNISPVKKMTLQRMIQELNNNDVQSWCKRAKSLTLEVPWIKRYNWLIKSEKVAHLPWNYCLTQNCLVDYTSVFLLCSSHFSMNVFRHQRFFFFFVLSLCIIDSFKQMFKRSHPHTFIQMRMTSDIIHGCNSMITGSLTKPLPYRGHWKSSLASLVFRLTPEDMRKSNMKKKLISIAPGSLCHAKICIGSCDYYACLFLWKLMRFGMVVMTALLWLWPNGNMSFIIGKR